MKTRQPRPEDRELWSRVAASVRPLHQDHPLLPGRQTTMPVDRKPPPPIPKPAPSRPQAHRSAAPSAPKPKPIPPPAGLDARTRRRIGSGRTSIDGRIDLHGMTADDAHERLHDFLALSRAIGRRNVLVITGKGFAGEGVLRREVPQWLSTPVFRQMVAAIDEAVLRHGGKGALYVRLRRPA